MKNLKLSAEEIEAYNTPTDIPCPIVFKTRQLGHWVDVSTDDIFKGKKVVIFSLPGAFTPTCSSKQLPGYEAAYEQLKKYVDEVYCISVNDSFVMNAWFEKQNIEKVKAIPDGNAEFTEGMSMLCKKYGKGFAWRSWRYSALILNGVVAKMFVEKGKIDNDEDDDPFEVSDAETMLNYLKDIKNG